MSIAFAEAVRTLLLADSTFAAACTGGISPDKIPEGNSLPAGDYSMTQSDSFSSLAGVAPELKECAISLRFFANTVAQLKTIQSAVEQVIKTNQFRVLVGSTTLCQLKCTDPQTSFDDYSDGQDEAPRLLTLTISGWVY